MAYNRRNLLTRIIRIQEITREHTDKGVTQKWVFENVILPIYPMNESTYYRYLGTNAKRDLKKLEEELKTH